MPDLLTSAAAGGSDDDVVNGRLVAVGTGHGSVRLLGGYDRPLGWGEACGDGGRGCRGRGGRSVAAAIVTMLVTVAADSVTVEMTDDQEGSAGGHPRCDAVIELQLRDRGVCVVGGDQVEALVRVPRGQVRLDPRHPLGDSSVVGALGGPVKCCGGDVGSGDLPATRREPDRLSSGAATCLERRPGRQIADLSDEVRVRLTGSHGRGAIALPDLVPVLVVECVLHCRGPFLYWGYGRHGPRRRDITLRDLAGETGISTGTLSRLEAGLRRPTLEQLLPLARALDELVDAPPSGDPRINLPPTPTQRNDPRP